MNRTNNQKSQALIYALVILVIFSVVSGVMFSLAINESLQQQRVESKNRARVIAQAGMNHAIEFLGQQLERYARNYHIYTDPFHDDYDPNSGIKNRLFATSNPNGADQVYIMKTDNDDTGGSEDIQIPIDCDSVANPWCDSNPDEVFNVRIVRNASNIGFIIDSTNYPLGILDSGGGPPVNWGIFRFLIESRGKILSEDNAEDLIQAKVTLLYRQKNPITGCESDWDGDDLDEWIPGCGRITGEDHISIDKPPSWFIMDIPPGLYNFNARLKLKTDQFNENFRVIAGAVDYYVMDVDMNPTYCDYCEYIAITDEGQHDPDCDGPSCDWWDPATQGEAAYDFFGFVEFGPQVLLAQDILCGGWHDTNPDCSDAEWDEEGWRGSEYDGANGDNVRECPHDCQVPHPVTGVLETVTCIEDGTDITNSIIFAPRYYCTHDEYACSIPGWPVCEDGDNKPQNSVLFQDFNFVLVEGGEEGGGEGADPAPGLTCPAIPTPTQPCVRLEALDWVAPGV